MKVKFAFALAALGFAIAATPAAKADTIQISFTGAGGTGTMTLTGTQIGGGASVITGGSLTVTGAYQDGTFLLIPGGPGVATSPLGDFNYDNVVTPGADPILDVNGLLFGIPGVELNIWGNGASAFWEGLPGQNWVEQSTVTLVVTSVSPEPSSLLLLGTGLFALAAGIFWKSRKPLQAL